ncbi:MAG: peptidylprolyl isomerase [Bryobacterales bacterium]|nr:peptidylprolyl isomerase [Bryobacterales bacterium]
MKSLITNGALSLSLILCSTLVAQTPASKGTTSKGTAIRASLLNPASLRAKAPETFKVRFTTTAGDFVVEVHRDWAPLGADRFYNLVKAGFFDNVAFYRVHSGFMVQFGISPKPAVAKAWDTASIKDDPVKGSNKRGTVTFATAGPNTRTTQLFINFADNSRLDAMGFAPFGNVVEGMDVVDKLYSGYGEIPPMGGSGPDPDKIGAEGDAYLVKNFPKIDKIKVAKIVPATPAAAPADKK